MRRLPVLVSLVLLTSCRTSTPPASLSAPPRVAATTSSSPAPATTPTPSASPTRVAVPVVRPTATLPGPKRSSTAPVPAASQAAGRQSPPPPPPSPPPPPPPPGFAPPTVTWSSFVSCKGSSGGWEFRALIDLVGGRSWRVATGNLQPVSGSRYSYSISGTNGGDGVSPAPPRQFTWSSTTLYDTSSSTKASFYELRFPAKWVVTGTCPS